MKLIDVEDESILKTVSVGGLSAKALWRIIKSQRTIKAIPIQWLKDWNKKNGDNWNLGYTIDFIIKEWEKENER